MTFRLNAQASAKFHTCQADSKEPRLAMKPNLIRQWAEDGEVHFLCATCGTHVAIPATDIKVEMEEFA